MLWKMVCQAWEIRFKDLQLVILCPQNWSSLIASPSPAGLLLVFVLVPSICHLLTISPSTTYPFIYLCMHPCIHPSLPLFHLSIHLSRIHLFNDPSIHPPPILYPFIQPPSVIYHARVYPPAIVYSSLSIHPCTIQPLPSNHPLSSIYPATIHLSIHPSIHLPSSHPSPINPPFHRSFVHPSIHPSPVHGSMHPCILTFLCPPPIRLPFIYLFIF